MTETCPFAGVATEFTPFDSPYLDDPYAFFQAARRRAAVFYSEEIDHWVITRYDDVKRVMRDHENFSAQNAQRPVTPWPDDAVEQFAAEHFDLRPNLSDNDPPSHTLVRGFLREAFGPRRIRWLEPHVRRLAEAAVDRVEEQLTREPGAEVDLVAAMLADVPAEVLFVFLGIPETDIDRVKQWSAGRAILTWGRPSADEVRGQMPGFIEYLRYCFDLVDTLEATPGDDYTSELIRRLATEEPEDFDKGRIAQTLFGLLMAGHETTTNQSASAMRALLSTPGAWQQLVEHPELCSNAVEELIRYDGSVIAWRRQARVDVDVSGVTIPAGAQVLTLLGSANRDPDKFENPECLDLERPNARRHLAFGFGNHHCIGAPLARLELGVFLEILPRRLPGLELVPTTYQFSPNTSHRGPLQLPVRLAR